MNNVDKTRLKGIEGQIRSWIPYIEQMEGYEAEDTNPYFEMVSHLENARDELFYALQDLKNNNE